MGQQYISNTSNYMRSSGCSNPHEIYRGSHVQDLTSIDLLADGLKHIEQIRLISPNHRDEMRGERRDEAGWGLT